MALSENPNLALIPSGYKSGKIYSVLPTSGVGDFDFSRSGPATRINSQGLIETVADGVPRLNYPLIDGKVVGCPSHLLEPQSTNLIQYSEAFDNAYWGKIGVSILGGFTDPKGGNNAYRVTATDKPNANVYLVAGSSINNAKSIFIKGVNGETTCVLNRFTDTKSLITLNGEWQRVDFVSENTTFFAVDMRGGTATEVQIFGAQNEILSYPTSYIPNYGTALGVTRSAETATNSGDASTFNDSEGVLMAEISALVEDNSVRYISLNDGSTSNRIRFGYTTPTNSFRLLVVSTGSAQVDLTEELNSITLFNKLAIKV